MLANYVRRKLPKPSIGSTDVLDMIKKVWVEKGRDLGASLDPREKVWEELWFHASSIHKICPRMYAQACAAGGIEGEEYDAETKWLFGQGNAYHDMIQQEVLPRFPREVFLGSWERFVPFIDPMSGEILPDVFCRETSGGVQESTDLVEIAKSWGARPEDKEDAHGIEKWRYVEAKIRMLDIRTVVKLDGILAWSNIDPDRQDEVLEIKTEKIEAKDDLNPALGGHPRAHHVEQAHLGMMGTGLKRARIMYVFKGAKTLSSAIVEHIVERDEDLVKELRERALDCVASVRKVEAFRDAQVVQLCGGEEAEFGSLANENQASIREEMAKLALDVPRLPVCVMKSKGKPKYCAGRDLCFPRKGKKK